jgi:hypothetical protein
MLDPTARCIPGRLVAVGSPHTPGPTCWIRSTILVQAGLRDCPNRCLIQGTSVVVSNVGQRLNNVTSIATQDRGFLAHYGASLRLAVLESRRCAADSTWFSVSFVNRFRQILCCLQRYFTNPTANTKGAIQIIRCALSVPELHSNPPALLGTVASLQLAVVVFRFSPTPVVANWSEVRGLPLLLRDGMGGLVLCVAEEEYNTWEV